MEHQTLETLDAPEEAQADAALANVLDRGASLLRTLQHAARAARLEAQVVELQAALEQARAGQPQALRAWLEQYEQPSSLTEQVRSPVEQIVADQVAGQVADQVANQVADQVADQFDETAREEGWSLYLSHARQRLAAIQLQRGTVRPWSPPDAKILDVSSNFGSRSCPSTDGEFVNDESIHHEALDGEFQPPASADSAQLDDELPGESLSDDVLPEAALACLVGLHGDTHAVTHSTAPSVPWRNRLLSSYGLSVAGHVIALIILGTVTYSAPGDGHSLGSQVLNAAEAPSEMELANDVELLEPAELQFSEPVTTPATPSTSMANELAQLSHTVSSTSVEVPATASVGSSIASAISEAANPSSSGARGSGSAVPSMSGKFFGVGSGGNYFCYVVDRSGSMRGGAWESAKAELVRSLKSLKATQKFYIVFFADEFEALPEPGSDEPAATGLYATAANIEHARDWIQSVQLTRGGPPNEALAWAIEREPDAIYLLTDGVTKVDVCAFLRKNNRIEDVVSGSQVRVPIHAIAYFSLDGQQLMRQLAKENQGQFIYVPKSKPPGANPSARSAR